MSIHSNSQWFGKAIVGNFRFFAIWLSISSLYSFATMEAQFLHPIDPSPSFEVAAIKPLDPNGRFRVSPLGSQQIVHVAGRSFGLVAMAYNVPTTSQLLPGAGLGLKFNEGGTIYTVEATIPDDIYARMQTMTIKERKEQAQLMLQSLLVDRFKVKVHFGTKDMPIYELTVGNDGSKLPSPVATPSGAEGWAMGPKGDVRFRNMKLEDILGQSMFGLSDRAIVNETGLMGTYNLTLNWNPPGKTSPLGAEAEDLKSTIDSQLSIFTVVQEQLGLKLVPSHGAVEVLVLDHIEAPSAN